MSGDVLDQLWAAFDSLHKPTSPIPVGPQLLADAHAEIVALRRELAAANRRADDHLEQLAVAVTAAHTERAQRLADLRNHQTEMDRVTANYEAAVRAHKAARRVAREYRQHEHDYHAAVAPLAEEIRRARAARSSAVAAPSLVDTRLALHAMKTIARANDLYARRRDRVAAPAQHHPEGMTA